MLPLAGHILIPVAGLDHGHIAVSVALDIRAYDLLDAGLQTGEVELAGATGQIFLAFRISVLIKAVGKFIKLLGVLNKLRVLGKVCDPQSAVHPLGFLAGQLIACKGVYNVVKGLTLPRLLAVCGALGVLEPLLNAALLAVDGHLSEK